MLRPLSVAVVTAAALTVPVAAYAALDSGGSVRPARTTAAVAAVVAARPTAAVASPRAAVPSRRSAPPVLVVKPGQRVNLGHGLWTELTATGVCDGDQHGPYGACKSVTDGNQAPDSVSLQTYGDRTGTLYRPLYIGSGKPVRMTVKAGRRTYELRVVTLAGRPGYAIGYGWGAPDPAKPGKPPFGDVVVTVYGASGTVLARL
ncbi:hypothetical protein [Streptacidiphilus sp. MAP12-16]|uniref:hypothetical protein n=1 Tax=Streptacidiphilus sp. MAP12-16 TaxID=3156300 RepID=UPI00351120A8